MKETMRALILSAGADRIFGSAEFWAVFRKLSG